MYINFAMGKKKVIIRQDSYVLSEHSVKHLRMLHDRLGEFIETTRPAFEKAVSIVPFSEQKMNYIQRGKDGERFVDTKDLQDWLVHKRNNLGKFIKKVEAGERNLTDNPLDNLRHIRAFFIRFESIVKSRSQFGSASMFKAEEPILAGILLKNFVPNQNEGGVFEIIRFILHDENFHPKDDLGKVRNLLRVGKTITYVVAALIRKEVGFVAGAEVDSLAYPAGDTEPKAVAATTRKPTQILEELGLDDTRTEKPVKLKIAKTHSRINTGEQTELRLSS
jgi:hypothetical protein